jgi:hypothetical protein
VRGLPAILALDFDGVLCDGRPEYFESSCRAYGHLWSPLALGRIRRLRSAFYRLRPVIKSGWEMPVLLRAIIEQIPPERVRAAWPTVRDRIVSRIGGTHEEAIGVTRRALDDVRRDWLRLAPQTWLDANRPYAPLPILRRIVAGVPRTVVVTTKEGEFTRRILDKWHVEVAEVAGKERGEHKCDNLAELLGTLPDPTAEVWFVEDRMETLEDVIDCTARDPRLARVRLFLAEWGYTTAVARAKARTHDRIRLLDRATFARGVAHWPR